MVLVCLPASGQGLLKKLGDRAKEAVEQNLGEKVEKGVNDLLDGKNKKDGKEKSKTEEAKEQLQKDNQLRMALQMVKALPRIRDIKN